MARDSLHYIVRSALEKDGWNITDDPLKIICRDVDMDIDLATGCFIAAEKSGENIAVQIQSFLSSSILSEFHTALGQFVNCRTVLSIQQPYRELFLAVPLFIYNSFFMLPFTQTVVSENQLKIVVYNIESEEIVQWIK